MFNLPRCYSCCWKFSRRRILCLTVLLRRFFQETSSFFLFHSHQVKKTFLANNYSYLLFHLFWWKKLSEKVLSYFLGKTHPLFSSLSVFAWSRFAFTSVLDLRFCLIFGFSWSPSFWTHLYLVLHFQFSVWTTTIAPSSCFYQKKLFKYSLFTCMGYLLMSFLLTDFSKSKKNLFVHFPYCWRTCFMIYLFLHVCPLFFRFFLLLFYSHVFLHNFLFLFSFLNVFLCWFLFIDIFFWGFSVWFDHRFFSPSYSPFFTKKKQCVLNCFLL